MIFYFLTVKNNCLVSLKLTPISSDPHVCHCLHVTFLTLEPLKTATLKTYITISTFNDTFMPNNLRDFLYLVCCTFETEGFFLLI